MADYGKSFQDGANFYAKEMGAYIGGASAEITNGKYLFSIQEQIDSLSDAINKYSGNNNPQLKGYVAEAWHTYTFNIDAASKNSSSRAFQVESNTLGSVDISTSWGEDYSLKYYKTGADSAMAQGHSLEWAYQKYIHNLNEGCPPPTREEYKLMSGIDPNTDMNLCMYEGQARLIPSDQIKDAIAALDKKISKELNNLDNPDRANVAKRLMQVRDNLTAHINGPNGEYSFNLSEKDSRALASLAKEGKFNPERYDITLARQADISFLCKNALRAGLNAAWISALLKMIPNLVESLKKLIDSGFLELDDLKSVCQAGAAGAKDGFLKGLFCAAITTASESGLFGQGIQTLSQSTSFAPVVGAIVVFMCQSVSDGISLAKGEISEIQYGYNIERNIYIASGGVLCGLALQAVVPVPVLGYAIGSMLGSLLSGLVFSVKEQVMMSLCVKNGYTVFGLVDQDYTMPDSVRVKLGFPVYGIEEYEFNKYTPKGYPFKGYTWKQYDWKSIECVLLKRGVIGCRKIAYVE